MASAKTRNPKSLYYRVSVLDEDKGKWIVRHAGLTQEKAEQLVSDYFENGFMARMSACV